MTKPRVHIAPGVPKIISSAVEAGGGTLAGAGEADAVVWLDAADPLGLGELLKRSPARWVQLPFAGIEEYFAAGVIDPARTWTCAKGVYGPATAELALTLIGVAARSVHRHVREGKWWRGDETTHTRIAGTTATIVGTGGIGTALTSMLSPLHVRVIGVNRTGRPLAGAEKTLTDVAEAAAEADWLVVAASLTDETRGLIGEEVFSRMKSTAWIVNIARGGLVDTSALVAALERGAIAGAALDVTDPEPLPDDHPLWRMENVIITGHTGNTWSMAAPDLAVLIQGNVAAFAAGKPLAGLVDPKLGY